MKSEPLDIQDKKFLVNRTIQQAPAGTVIREFFKNAEESAASAPVGKRYVRIYPVQIEGVRKIAFWNTGRGMSSTELRQATDLSSSIGKELGIDRNFGIGAKVSGLAVSKDGIRYRSCKDRCVHEVIIGYDDEQATYVRFASQLPNSSFEVILDVTELVKLEGQDVSFDWTEVVLFGGYPDHDTVAEPVGKGRVVDRSYVPTTIFRRFSEIAEGVEVRIDVSMTKGGGKDETGRARRLKLLSDVIHEVSLRSELVGGGVNGISVRYTNDPKAENSAHTLSSRANPATASTTFCALVHKGERYDFKTKQGWSVSAPDFGIPFGSKVLTVEIMIPDTVAMPNQYRDQLTFPEDRSPMVAGDFSAIVRALMPEWVKEVVRRESPQATENLDDLQNDLQKILDEFRIPTTVQKISKDPSARISMPSESGQDTPNVTTIEDDLEGEAGLAAGDYARKSKENRATPKKVRQAPQGAQASLSTKALERVPKLEILTDLEQIEDKELRGRAGRFYRDGQELFINGLYPVVDRMLFELEREFAGLGDPEVIREMVLRASRRSMAFRVGKVVCFALSKRLSDDWGDSDLDKATSPESLSMAADDYRQSLAMAKRWVKEMLKLTQVEEAAVA